VETRTALYHVTSVTPNSLMTYEVPESDRQMILGRGHCVSIEDVTLYACAADGPVRNQKGNVAPTIAISGIVQRFGAIACRT
jgi:hypothetical protein